MDPRSSRTEMRPRFFTARSYRSRQFFRGKCRPRQPVMSFYHQSESTRTSRRRENKGNSARFFQEIPRDKAFTVIPGECEETRDEGGLWAQLPHNSRYDFGWLALSAYFRRVIDL